MPARPAATRTRRPGRPALAADDRIDLIWRIVELRRGGGSLRQIAQVLGISKSFVGAILNHLADGCAVARGLTGGPILRQRPGKTRPDRPEGQSPSAPTP